MHIELSKLNFTFSSPPLLIGGMAMQYYGLRPSGADIDFVITRADYARLARQYPDNLKDLWGDLGVCVFEFEIWQSICLFDYDFLSQGALDPAAPGEVAYRVISLEKLLFLKALAMRIDKYHADLELIVKKILEEKTAPWWAGLSDAQRKKYFPEYEAKG
jgi:hypothetical protein